MKHRKSALHAARRIFCLLLTYIVGIHLFDTCNASGYYDAMIQSIRHKGLAALHESGQTKGVTQVHVKRLRQILFLLDTAKTLDDMALPGMRLHALKGDLVGFYAVNVSGNWRVMFRFENDAVLDVDYIDYH